MPSLMSADRATFIACGRTWTVHPACVMFPLLDGDGLAALVADIRRHGLHEAVMVDGDELLDGRNRLRACDLAGVAPHFAQWRRNGASKTDFIVSLNLRRRHLDSGQLAMLGHDLRPIFDAEAKERQRAAAEETNRRKAGPPRTLVEIVPQASVPAPKSRDLAGAAVGVSGRYVDDAGKVAAASPALAAEVRAGTLSLPRAKARIRREERQGAVKAASREPTPLTGALGRFPVIYADPPWTYDAGSTDPLRRIDNHYPTMALDDIRALPVADIATDDAALFLWTTNPKLEEALSVLDAWGFAYRTNLVWVKDRIGMGYFARARHELLLVGVRGDLPTPEPATRPDSVIVAPRMAHSAKPAEAYTLIERMYPDLRRIELFARHRRPGWEAWGDQV